VLGEDAARGAALRDLMQRRSRGEQLLMAGVGAGLSARCAAEAGADLVVAYHSSPLRLAGLASVAGSLPLADANSLADALTDEILACGLDAPVVTTVFAADPRRNIDRWLDGLGARKVTGILNAPSVGSLSGPIRAEIDRSGLGYARDVALVRRASESGLLTCAYCFGLDDADAMLEAGADILVAHLGLTADSPRSDAIAGCAELLQLYVERARTDGPALVLAHGGPLRRPADYQAVLDAGADVDGFFGVSSIERIPITRAVTATAREFKSCKPMKRDWS